MWVKTTDICPGDEIKFTECKREITAKIIKDVYGVEINEHTFTLEVIGSRERIFRQGQDIYRNGVTRQLWIDECARDIILDEKHQRGFVSRLARVNKEILAKRRSEALTRCQLTAK